MKMIFNSLSQYTHEGYDSIETFEDLHHQSSLFALSLQQYLKRYDIPKSDVEIYLEDTFHFAIAFFGCLMANVRVYILSKNIPSKKRLYINDENFYTFFTPHNFYNMKEPLCLNPHATFYIRPTGASGENRNIPKTVNQMIKEAHFLTTYLAITPQHTIFTSLSHKYLYGLCFKIFIPLISGAHINLSGFNTLTDIVAFTKKHENHLIFATFPKILKTLLQDAPRETFTPIQTIITSGSALDQATRNILRSTTEHKKEPLRLVDLYANTEAGVIGANEGQGLKAFDPVNVELDSEKRLMIESEWQKNVFNDNKFISNDCAVLVNKNIHLLGRYDRLINIQGNINSLDDIEEEIKNHSFIDDIFIGITQNAHHLQALILLSQEGKIFFREHGKASLMQTLKANLKEELQKEIIFHIRKELPYNIQGKITKNAFKRCLSQKNYIKFDSLLEHDNTILTEAYIGEDCSYFDHSPFIAGFTQLSFIYQLLQQHWNIAYHKIKQINQVDFLLPIQPLDTISIKISRENEDLFFQIKVNHQEYTVGSIKIVS